MTKQEKKAFAKGALVSGSIFAALAGAQALIVKKVPYSYRTGGFSVLAEYIWDASPKLRNLLGHR